MNAEIANILKYVAIMSFILVALAHSQEPKVLLQEGFNSLDNWEPFYFRKIDEHSSYTVKSSEEGSYLKRRATALHPRSYISHSSTSTNIHTSNGAGKWRTCIKGEMPDPRRAMTTRSAYILCSNTTRKRQDSSTK